MLTSEIRKSFLNFFKSNNHQIISSSPLVPQNDPTLMFTNSGMVQFKNVFTCEEKTLYKTATTVQKCVRAGGKHNDLENVGYTSRHHTFFEMLGNFSFGEYFKEQAITYAWDYLTKVLNLSKDKLYVTVYYEDEESANIWKKVSGFNDSKIIRINTNDNFWFMGPTGPCGPCTEIFYDHGDKIFGGLPGTKDQDGDRYVEIWNIVFMQYEQLADGSRIKLPQACVDTGAGLERLAAVMQNVPENYQIDLFQHLIKNISDIANIKVTNDNLSSFKVISDHLRSCSFLIADGVMPSNDGRGYVLRRILRRAIRHIHKIESKDILMTKLVPALVNEMGHAYPELIRAKSLIEESFYQEELKFKRTLEKGMKLLHEGIKEQKDHKIFSGETAFKLYDTYGFPLDLTKDILRENNFELSEHEFEAAMLKQKQLAKKSWKGSGEEQIAEIWFDLLEKHGATEFLGYMHTEAKANILEIFAFNEDTKLVITNQTPFYAESGGQIGDSGFLIDKENNKYKIINTLKFIGKLHAHICKIPENLKNQEVTLQVDVKRRKAIKANHSATHLLHLALRSILGEHITQKGSLVLENKLRFDFSHAKALSSQELEQIECAVNEMICKNSNAQIQSLSLDEAVKSGAMALFGEKYDSEVRVITMGKSVELCGGTHVNATGDIGSFKIISESAIASGIRRIEAVTGEFAIKLMQEQSNTLNKMISLLKVTPSEIYQATETLFENYKKLQKQFNDLRLNNIQQNILATQDIHKIQNYNFIATITDDLTPQEARQVAENISKLIDHIIIICSKFEDKTSLVVAVNKNILLIDAKELVDIAVNAISGNKGGGKKEIAQAGGFDFDKCNIAINAIEQHIKTMILS